MVVSVKTVSKMLHPPLVRFVVTGNDEYKKKDFLLVVSLFLNQYDAWYLSTFDAVQVSLRGI